MQNMQIDLNQADTKRLLIPADTIVKASVNVIHGGHGEDGILYKSKSGSTSLKTTFTITDREYACHVLYHFIGIEGTKLDEQGRDTFKRMGARDLRSIIESAYNIHPKDESEGAKKARLLTSYIDIDGLIVLVRIGVQEDKTGQLFDRNIIKEILTPDCGLYNDCMAEETMSF